MSEKTTCPTCSMALLRHSVGPTAEGGFTFECAACVEKEAEIARLNGYLIRTISQIREQRKSEHMRSCNGECGMSVDALMRVIDDGITAEFGLRIVDGKVEDVGNG